MAPTVYLFEPDYVDQPAQELAKILRAVVRCVGRFSDRYRAWPVGHPDEMRVGPLPDDSTERDALLTLVMDWAESAVSREVTSEEVSQTPERLRRRRAAC